jgi:photosystem II stability/assembly factor-like uncharacterized protein
MAQLSGRRRRALALITISLLVLAGASLAWIVPGLHLGGVARSRTAAAIPPPPPAYPTSYAFVKRSLGWAHVARPGGGSTLFRTDDGGKHWRRLTDLAGDWVGGTIQFMDETHGFVLTTRPVQLHRTTDGGAHWDTVALPDASGISTDGITFADARHGWSIVPPTRSGQGPAIYGTSDGGDTWTHLSDLPQDVFGPVFRGSEGWLGAHGWADQLRVYASFDGGLSWTSRAVPRPPGSQFDAANPPNFSARVELLPGGGVVAFVWTGSMCRNHGPCASNHEAEFTSFDGGVTWTYVPTPAGEYIATDIGYADARHWWSAASGSLYQSSDAGQTWKQIPGVLLPSGRCSFHFFDSGHAWVHVSTALVDVRDTDQLQRYSSTLLFTSDAGRHWVKVPSATVSQAFT